MKKKQVKKSPKMTKAKATALQLIKKYPDVTLMDIGRKLNELKLINRPEQIYNLTRADRDDGYANKERFKAKEKNWEMIDTEILPEGLKIHKRVLKNKKIPDLKKKDWVFQAEKVGFGIDESRRPAFPNTIAIQTLAFIQNSTRVYGEKKLEFFEENPEDTSNAAFEVWLKKKGITGPIIDVVPEQTDQKEDA